MARRDYSEGGGCQNGDVMVVTEYMRGGSLNESLVKLRYLGGQLREGRFLRVARQVCNGFRCIHKRELTYGDIELHAILLTSPMCI